MKASLELKSTHNLEEMGGWLGVWHLGLLSRLCLVFFWQWLRCGHLHYQLSWSLPVRGGQLQSQHHRGGEPQAAAEDPPGETSRNKWRGQGTWMVLGQVMFVVEGLRSLSLFRVIKGLTNEDLCFSTFTSCLVKSGMWHKTSHSLKMIHKNEKPKCALLLHDSAKILPSY